MAEFVQPVPGPVHKPDDSITQFPVGLQLPSKLQRARVGAHNQDVAQVVAPQAHLSQKVSQGVAPQYGGGCGSQPEHAQKHWPEPLHPNQAAHQEQGQGTQSGSLQNAEIFAAMARQPPGLVQAKKGKQEMPK